MIVGKSYLAEQRKTYFLPSCYLNTVFAQWVVTKSSGITTESEIQDFVDLGQIVSIFLNLIPYQIDWCASRSCS